MHLIISILAFGLMLWFGAFFVEPTALMGALNTVLLVVGGIVAFGHVTMQRFVPAASYFAVLALALGALGLTISEAPFIVPGIIVPLIGGIASGFLWLPSLYPSLANPDQKALAGLGVGLAFMAVLGAEALLARGELFSSFIALIVPAVMAGVAWPDTFASATASRAR